MITAMFDLPGLLIPDLSSQPLPASTPAPFLCQPFISLFWSLQ